MSQIYGGQTQTIYSGTTESAALPDGTIVHGPEGNTISDYGWSYGLVAQRAGIWKSFDYNLSCSEYFSLN